MDRETITANINGEITAAEVMLKGLQMGLDKLIAERNELERQRSPNAAKLAALEEELRACLAKKDQLDADLARLRDQIAGVESDIQTTQDSAAAAPATIQQINIQIPIVDQKIADLERQLALARAERTQLVADRTAAQNLINNAASEVARLTRVLSGLQAQIPSIERQIASTQANCDKIND